jgi:hypothetical protein
MKVIHVLADGSVKDDLTGYEVKPEIAGDFYNVLSKIYRSGTNEKNNEKKN